MNFPDARIYKITCNITNKVYIGSTCSSNLKKRLDMHANSYTAYMKGNYHYLSSFDVLEHGDYRIDLLQIVENCHYKSVLYVHERFHIQNTINCINRNVAGRGHAECMRNYRLKVRNNIN